MSIYTDGKLTFTVKESKCYYQSNSFISSDCILSVQCQYLTILPLITSHSITEFWLVLISHATEHRRRLSWRGVGLPAQRWSPIPVLTGPDVE